MNIYRTEALERRFISGASTIRALGGIDLQVGAGEYLAVVGPSGSGKTTLLQLFGLLDGQFIGALFFRDQDVAQLSATQRARLRLDSIGMVYQAFHLIPALDARDNVALPHWRLHGARRPARQRAEKLLCELGLAHRLRHRVTRLSAGEMQRVAVARAMINEPAVILADEPTGNLDAASTQTVLETFQRINDSGTTIVVITHEPEVRDAAKRVVALRYGCIDKAEVTQ